MPRQVNHYALPHLVMIAVLATGAFAQDKPNSIVYQGRLADISGAAITTTVDVNFAIYDLAQSGTLLWESSYSITPNGDGVFTQELGPIADSVFSGGKLYLGIKVGADPEMTPRQVLSSAPYAFQSLTLADNSVTEASIATGAVTNTKIATGAVSISKMANDAITSASIKDGTISTADIAQNGATANQTLSWDGKNWGTVDLSVEAGIVRHYKSYKEIDSIGLTCIDSASINVPGAGYVLAFAFGYGILTSDITGVSGNMLIGFATSRTENGTNESVWGSANATMDSIEYFWSALSMEMTYSVPSAGTYTYYLNAHRGYRNGTAAIENCRIILMYFPTSYGSVNKIVHSGEEAAFENAIPINIDANPADPNASSTVMYQVDLRELEIKALKAQLEAEKAQQKLDRARALQKANSHKENK